MIVEKYFNSNNNTYKVDTYNFKMVADYLNITFFDLFRLSYKEYLYYKKEAWIYKQQQTEQGQQFLLELFELQESQADYENIKRVSIKT